jgi:hypothetical protein
MNTEQQLRHAAQEMDRATASLTPPPIGELRRSARMRAIGVSVAAAVGVAVLVGGAVLVLSPRGETTLRPASPTETTVVTVDGLPIVIPELDPPPSFDLGEGSQEMKFQEPGEHLSADVGAQSLELVASISNRSTMSSFSVLLEIAAHMPSSERLGRGCRRILRDSPGNVCTRMWEGLHPGVVAVTPVSASRSCPAFLSKTTPPRSLSRAGHLKGRV